VACVYIEFIHLGCMDGGVNVRYSDCGIVHLKAIKRPFIAHREIKKGKDKGKIRLTLLSKEITVNKASIERYPKEESNGNMV